jgi:signal recognition particle subunit SRP54
MFDTLSERFETIFTRLRGKGKLRAEDVDAVLRDIRLALLDADVSLSVVRQMIERIREACVGIEASKSLSPSQQVVKAVNAELVRVLGGQTLKITYASRPPTVLLLAGLQGSGKTTTAAKLAAWFKQQGRNPLLVGADLARPAAVEQLRVLGGQVGVTVFSEPTDPVTVAKAGLAEARRLGRDVLIVDTAGRLAIDEALMAEVRAISDAISPHYRFLVVDAMTGQDAVGTAEAFHRTLELEAIILTKLDGDARGGAALSVKEVVGRPIAFASTGEKLGDFDTFHPDRMASRILGMGDVLTLIEQAERTYDQEVAARAASRLNEGNFDLDDLLEQMRQVRKLGSLKGVIGMLPGVPKEVKDADVNEKDLSKIEAMICSMTAEERANPAVIDASRRNRIAAGSGTTVVDVNQLLKQFKDMQKVMKSMGFSRMMGMAGGRPKLGGTKPKTKAARSKPNKGRRAGRGR